jgi:hypothetical protein
LALPAIFQVGLAIAPALRVCTKKVLGTRTGGVSTSQGTQRSRADRLAHAPSAIAGESARVTKIVRPTYTGSRIPFSFYDDPRFPDRMCGLSPRAGHTVEGVAHSAELLLERSITVLDDDAISSHTYNCGRRRGDTVQINDNPGINRQPAPLVVTAEPNALISDGVEHAVQNGHVAQSPLGIRRPHSDPPLSKRPE